jgi:hypothetical protein
LGGTSELVTGAYEVLAAEMRVHDRAIGSRVDELIVPFVRQIQAFECQGQAIGDVPRSGEIDIQRLVRAFRILQHRCVCIRNTRIARRNERQKTISLGG